MSEIFKIISIFLFVLVGVISLNMALKSLFSKKFIPFHEIAADKSLEDLEKPLQSVILSLMRVSGLGFLVIALILIIFPIVNYFVQDDFVKFAIPGISLLFCLGLFQINYDLYKRTNAKTPWRNSLFAAIIIILGMILSNL